MLVNEVMKEKAAVIHFDHTVEEAAKLMEQGDFGSLPVERDGKMVGMITDRDIVVRAVAKGKDPKKTTVSECMSEGISYCYQDEDVEAIAHKMAAVQVRRLPVIDRNKKLVGIVSLSDIARRVKNEKLTQEIVSQTAH
ncbi:MAG: CBS domain-containing protein [Pseudobdellovibrionaceae bacterium]